ncbi:MAG: mechanosensitive ion channel family protein [Cellulosilyticaceae bacterium]
MNLLLTPKVLPQYYFYMSLGIALLILIFTIAFKKLLRKGIIGLFNNVKFKTPVVLESLNQALAGPLDYWILITGAYVAILTSPFVTIVGRKPIPLWIGSETQLELNFIASQSIHTAYKIAMIILITWAIYNLIGVYEIILLSIGSKFTLLDNTVLIRFTVKVLRFLTLLVGIALLADMLIDLTYIVTSIGIAGAALTFVAKDTLTNIISGIVLMIDKPFGIGDWIQVAGLEGVVEDVSFRSTRLRTFTQGLVVIPNATLSNDNIINWSAMPKRKVTFDVGLTYDSTNTQIKQCIADIEVMLGQFEDIEKDSALVYFNSFGDYSLNISVAYFSYFTDLARYVKLKEKVNFEITEIVSKNGLEFAFPTQSLIVDSHPQIKETI